MNCAGGFGLGRRSWLTGEETIGGPAKSRPREAVRAPPRLPVRGAARPRARTSSSSGVPLRAAGRFSHEAASTDQRTGIVYETEDPGSGRGAGFYRFIPRTRRTWPRAGGSRSSASRASRATTRARARPSGASCRSAGSTSPSPIPSMSTTTTRAARSARDGDWARRCSTGSRAAGTTATTAAPTSSRPAAATRRTATSTPTATARASARSGSTGRARAPAGC